MDVVMCAKMILTKIMFWTSLMYARKTLPSVKPTSADSRWFLWTPRVPPRSTPTGLSGIRAKSWSRLSTATLALLSVCNIQTDVLLQWTQTGSKLILTHLFFKIQVMMSSAQWTSVERSSSTRTEMMTTLVSCLATNPARASTQWCGNRSPRRTGPTHPQELRATPACQSKWSTRPQGPVSTWGTPCGTPETPQARWAQLNWLRVWGVIEENVWDFSHCNFC